jgi:hypothetical protein
MTAEGVVHLVREGRYPHVVARGDGLPPVHQSQRLDEVTCGLCLGAAGDFLPKRRTGYSCPECLQGKHPNCNKTAWDTAKDSPTVCWCWERGHST